MKNDTRERILNFIKDRNRVSAHEIISYFHLNASGVFRHLNKLLRDGKIIKNGKTPKVVYSPVGLTQKAVSSVIQNGFIWNKQNTPLPSEVYCPTRDVFQARQDRALHDLLHKFNETISYLLVLIVGEIGNNSFDHNLGSWHDTPGIYFAVDFEERNILISDRGQGVFNTLKKVRPDIKTDKEALRIAFTEKISGRAPERRGNGLKLVKKIIEEQNWKLDFYSGNCLLHIENGIFNFEVLNKKIIGTIALLKF